MWRWPNAPYAATLPWFSEKCVRSVGALPAPEMPDFASMTTSLAASIRPARASGSERQQRGRRIAAGVRDEPGVADGRRLELASGRRRHPSGSARRRRIPARRAASSRSRNAPERSMTRKPASSSGGAELGRRRLGQRQEHDVCLALTTSRSSGRTSPSQMRASAGRRRGVLVACETSPASASAPGWRASRRTSSCPA